VTGFYAVTQRHHAAAQWPTIAPLCTLRFADLWAKQDPAEIGEAYLLRFGSGGSAGIADDIPIGWHHVVRFAMADAAAKAGAAVPQIRTAAPTSQLID
jgi:hypothetical protein